MASVFERVRKIVVDQLGVEEGEVIPTASFVEDLNADSLDLDQALFVEQVGAGEGFEVRYALADAAPGFVWRLQDDSGNATAIQAFADPHLLINMSVWDSASCQSGVETV